MNITELVVKWNGGRKYGAVRNFARAIGRSELLVGEYIRGIRTPGSETLAKMAEVLGTNPSALTDGGARVAEPSATYGAPAAAVVQVPVVGRVSASGVDFDPDAAPSGYAPFPMFAPRRGKLYALRVSGDSMEPDVRDGGFVIIQAPVTETPADGKRVVVRVDGQQLLKRIHRVGGHIELRSDNPKHKPIPLAGSKVEFVGTVVAWGRFEE